MPWQDEATRALKQPLKHHAAGEMTGATCPICGTGHDRLVVFEEGNFWCRKCNHRGYWKLSSVNGVKPDARRTSDIYREKMSGCQDWIEYHDRVLGEQSIRELWGRWGVLEQEIHTWGLGYTDRCPSETNSPSLTIPVWSNNILTDIRHRLLSDQVSGKYRSHKPGLKPTIFNVDSIGMSETVLVVEGEIKTIILSRIWKSVVGLPGKQHSILELNIDPLQTVVLMLDPGSDEESQRMAQDLKDRGIRSRIAFPFDKPDDLLLEFGEDVVMAIVEQAIPF